MCSTTRAARGRRGVRASGPGRGGSSRRAGRAGRAARAEPAPRTSTAVRMPRARSAAERRRPPSSAGVASAAAGVAPRAPRAGTPERRSAAQSWSGRRPVPPRGRQHDPDRHGRGRPAGRRVEHLGQRGSSRAARTALGRRGRASAPTTRPSTSVSGRKRTSVRTPSGRPGSAGGTGAVRRGPACRPGRRRGRTSPRTWPRRRTGADRECRGLVGCADDADARADAHRTRRASPGGRPARGSARRSRGLLEAHAGSRAANSSPPRRASTSVGRSAGRIRAQLLEQLVTHVVAEAVVDRLEPVQVEQQERRGSSGAQLLAGPARSSARRFGRPVRSSVAACGASRAASAPPGR